MGTALDDLDLDFARNHYLPNAIAPEVLERNEDPPSTNCVRCG